MSDSGIQIFEGLDIPLAEITFTTARSSGPGGQHVNKTETKVTLVFDLDGSTALDEDQKALLRERLATRITKSGELRMASQRHRSQKANREATIERFIDLVRDALAETGAGMRALGARSTSLEDVFLAADEDRP